MKAVITKLHLSSKTSLFSLQNCSHKYVCRAENYVTFTGSCSKSVWISVIICCSEEIFMLMFPVTLYAFAKNSK